MAFTFSMNLMRLARQCGLTNDVGEIRRVLNSFLQMIEQDQSHSLIIAATNHVDISIMLYFVVLTYVLHYALPDDVQIVVLLRARLHQYSAKGISWKRLSESTSGLSYAEISRVAEEVLKEALIQDRESVTEIDIRQALLERQNIAGKLKNKI